MAKVDNGRSQLATAIKGLIQGKSPPGLESGIPQNEVVERFRLGLYSPSAIIIFCAFARLIGYKNNKNPLGLVQRANSVFRGGFYSHHIQIKIVIRMKKTSL